MKKTTGVIIFAGVALLIGCLIYTIARDESIYLNLSLHSIGDGGLYLFLQDLAPNAFFPQWMIYSLPDGLWMMSFVMIVLLIWDFKLDRKSSPWLGACVLAGILLEILQGLGVVQGTFDVTDLVFQLIAASIPISFIFCKSFVCEIK